MKNRNFEALEKPSAVLFYLHVTTTIQSYSLRSMNRYHVDAAESNVPLAETAKEQQALVKTRQRRPIHIFGLRNPPRMAFGEDQAAHALRNKGYARWSYMEQQWVDVPKGTAAAAAAATATATATATAALLQAILLLVYTNTSCPF